MPSSFVEVMQKQEHKRVVFWQDNRVSQLFRKTSDIFKSTMRTKKAIFILLYYGSLQFLNLNGP